MARVLLAMLLGLIFGGSVLYIWTEATGETYCEPPAECAQSEGE